jgi:hypothetical protein
LGSPQPAATGERRFEKEIAMDEELRGYLEKMEGRIIARMNDQHERMLNRLSSIERDFHNTKGFLVGDALVSGGRWRDLEQRVTKLEDGRSP